MFCNSKNKFKTVRRISQSIKESWCKLKPLSVWVLPFSTKLYADWPRKISSAAVAGILMLEVPFLQF